MAEQLRAGSQFYLKFIQYQRIHTKVITRCTATIGRIKIQGDARELGLLDPQTGKARSGIDQRVLSSATIRPTARYCLEYAFSFSSDVCVGRPSSKGIVQMPSRYASHDTSDDANFALRVGFHGLLRACCDPRTQIRKCPAYIEPDKSFIVCSTFRSR